MPAYRLRFLAWAWPFFEASRTSIWPGGGDFDAGGYGNLVVITHRLGMTSHYAHLDRILVLPGRCVVAGDPIGTVGSTGRSTGPHLHFELRLRGALVDPLSGL